MFQELENTIVNYCYIICSEFFYTVTKEWLFFNRFCNAPFCESVQSNLVNLTQPLKYIGVKKVFCAYELFNPLTHVVELDECMFYFVYLS